MESNTSQSWEEPVRVNVAVAVAVAALELRDVEHHPQPARLKNRQPLQHKPEHRHLLRLRPTTIRSCWFTQLQTKPDFSGEWILDRQACTLSPGADAMRTAVVRIEHSDPTFRYQGEFVSDTGTVKPEFELMTSGPVLVWEGDALLFRHVDGDFKLSFRYELIDDGRRLQAVEVLRSPGRNQDNVWIFDRRGIDH
jgi:hypothetical protein